MSCSTEQAAFFLKKTTILIRSSLNRINILSFDNFIFTCAGEVASSSDIEEDKPQTASPKEKEDNASDENEVSETGSLSDTDEDKSGDKGSSKSKKKKKHKHKHKKKKKHKSQSKDKKERDKHSLEKEMKIAKNKIKDGKTRNDAEGATDKKHSKERRG